MQTEDYWDTLPDRISQHRQYFEGMIKLIPHNVYIPKIQDENTHWDRRFKKKMTPEEMQDRNYTRKMNKLKKYDVEEDAGDKEQASEDGEKQDEPQIEIIPGFVNSSSNPEELKRRLHGKIEEMKKKRKADDSDNLGNPRKKRKLEKEKKKKTRTPKQKPTSPALPPREDLMSRRASEAIQSREDNDFGKKDNHSLNLGKKDNHSLDFGYFDMSSGKPVPMYLKQEKKKGPSKISLLQQAQERRQRLEELKGTEKGEKLAEEEGWDNMFKKLENKKVKDDIKKIKKSIKQQQSKKKKSSKEWAARIQAQQKRQEEQQKKRQQNIEKRKQHRLDNKTGSKKAPKRPGFEGKKSQFINKDKNP
eukprot:TRINITY_DN10362_c0_g1_i3.p1 TRINITY_DN10362_c0_g1~~TRINITY_DN10362_c0_g1_i3.p1  ORF type:complete len:361 (+),score=119.13 TRINITY_DN10362_c0_g1_i3:133-1215(+)